MSKANFPARNNPGKFSVNDYPMSRAPVVMHKLPYPSRRRNDALRQPNIPTNFRCPAYLLSQTPVPGMSQTNQLSIGWGICTV